LNEVNALISLLHANGLIDYWISKYANSKYLQDTTDGNPSKINFQQVEGIFIIWFFGIMLSVTLFAVEYAWKRGNLEKHRFFRGIHKV
jgi:hypothetical protein